MDVKVVPKVTWFRKDLENKKDHLTLAQNHSASMPGAHFLAIIAQGRQGS